MPEDKDFELDDLDSFSFDEVPLEGDESGAGAAAGSNDEFGVWVKSAPEDVTEGLPGLDGLPELDDLPELQDLPDFDGAPETTGSPDSLPDRLPDLDELDDLDNLPDLDDLPALDVPAAEFDTSPEFPPSAAADAGLPEEDFLSTEELASLDDQFDFVTVSEEPLEGEESPDLETPAAPPSGAADGDYSEISLDDFVTFDEDPVETPALPAALPDSVPQGSEDEFDEEFLDIDIDIDDDIDDEELEILEGAKVVRENADAKPSFASEEVDLAEFGDFGEVSDFEPTAAPVAEEVDEFGVELSADDLTLDGDFEETILDDSLDPDDHTDQDRIRELEEHLTSGIRAPAEPALGGDAATAILTKIERELSSIKQEISELKKGLQNRPASSGAPSAPAEAFDLPAEEADEPASPTAPAAEKPHKGFFDEEDDETIALTGDELDNILSTAEISEADDSGESLEEDLIVTDAEGNLQLEPEPVPEADPGQELSLEDELEAGFEPAESALPELAEEDVHVTDEEFFAGTALESSESVFEPEATEGGVPESIELEEDFPLSLESDQTVDLLSDDGGFDELESVVEGGPEDLASPEAEVALESVAEDDLDLEVEELTLDEPTVERLEIPFDDDLSLDEPKVAEDLLQPTQSDEEAFSMPVEDYSVEELPSEPEEESEPPRREPAFVPEPEVVAEAPKSTIPDGLREELKAVLAYMDKLLVSLPDDKIQEFAESEHFEVYKKLFEELGLKE